MGTGHPARVALTLWAQSTMDLWLRAGPCSGLGPLLRPRLVKSVCKNSCPSLCPKSPRFRRSLQSRLRSRHYSGIINSSNSRIPATAFGLVALPQKGLKRFVGRRLRLGRRSAGSGVTRGSRSLPQCTRDLVYSLTSPGSVSGSTQAPSPSLCICKDFSIFLSPV